MSIPDYPFLRYLPFLIFGVLLSQKGLPIPLVFPAALLVLCWVLYGFYISRKEEGKTLIPAILAYAMLVCFGFLFSEIHKNRSAESVDLSLEGCDSYLASVEKFDLAKPNSQENLLEVIQIRDSLGWHSAKGKVLIYHKSASPLLPGQVILVEKSPDRIPPPIFPDEFDYRGFLARKDIHFRQFVGERFLLLDSSGVDSPKFWLANFRRKLAEILEEKVPNAESQQIAAALLLGQKENLDKDIRSAYAQTGTMHILAVSGLHVGIIYAILLFPLKGIRLKPPHRRLYLILVIVLIWVYAVLTGFSPSVVRAAAMFSLLTAGQLRKRKTASWNILAFSAMGMIVVDPGVIYEVGFQLSYLAVGGILLLQPMILRWWLPPNRKLEYFWQLTVVSLAAQLATFPLSIFYFHLFPSYFLIANLIIIPLSFIVMNAGILLLALSWIPVVSDGLGYAVSGLIWAQNWITRFIQDFPGGNLERLTMTFSGMVLIWVLLVIWANWEFGDRKKLVYLASCVFLLWSGERLIREVKQPGSELLIFSGEKGILLDLKVGDQFYSWNENFPPEQITFSIDPNRIANHRPQFPESIAAVDSDSLRGFPIWDFQFDPKEKRLIWGKEQPVRVERLGRDGSVDQNASDSLLVNTGAFRVVF